MNDGSVPGPFTVRLYREDLNFSAGHISTYGGLMEGQHGHNYQISISFTGTLDADLLVVDFRTVKKVLRGIITRLNHRTLVPARHSRLTIESLDGSTRISLGSEKIEMPTSNLVLLDLPNVTSEMLALYFFTEVTRLMPVDELERIDEITVEIIESPGQSASYTGHPSRSGST